MKLEKIINLHLSFMKSLIEEGEVLPLLESDGVSILPGFVERAEIVRSYYQKFYSTSCPRLVMCGINPGRLGAGKTGVPFIDFSGLSQLLPGIARKDREMSAQFMLSVINEYGATSFHDAVYLTNLSWYGFIQGGKNLNYYKLTNRLQDYFTKSFLEEMKIVQPTLIVPLSQEVHRSLHKMAADGLLTYPIGEPLPHPVYSAFPSRIDSHLEIYHKYIQKNTALQRGRTSYMTSQVKNSTIKENKESDEFNPTGFMEYLKTRHLVNSEHSPLSMTTVKQYHNRLVNLQKLRIYNGESELTNEMKTLICEHYNDSANMYPRTIQYYIEYLDYHKRRVF